MVETMVCWYFRGIEPFKGLLRGAKRILSTVESSPFVCLGQVVEREFHPFGLERVTRSVLPELSAADLSCCVRRSSGVVTILAGAIGRE